MPEKLSGAVVAGLKKTVERHERKERDAAEDSVPVAASGAQPGGATATAPTPPVVRETKPPAPPAPVGTRTPHGLLPFVWLRRRKAIWYPFLFLLTLGTALLAYDVYRGGDISRANDHAAAAGYLIYLNDATYLVYLCLALWAAVPLVVLTVTTVIPWLALLSGAGIVLYQLYGFLHDGVWTTMGADRLIDATGWVPADGLWASALEATPLSVLLLVAGGLWYAATARYRR